MASAPLDPAESRRLRKLIRGDRAAAGRSLSALPLDAQVGFVCDTPVEQRAAVLAALDAPEPVIAALPEAELCFTVKAIGLHDSGWILEHATPDQVVAAVDLDVWSGFELDLTALSEWIDAIATTDRPAMLRAVLALHPELAVLLVRQSRSIDRQIRPAMSLPHQYCNGLGTRRGGWHLRDCFD